MPNPKEIGIPAPREVSISEDMPLRFTVKTIFTIIGFVLVLAASWFNIKADVSDHSAKLTVIQAVIGADHDQLQKQSAILETQGRLLERMDDKLDYVTGARRTRPEPAVHP